MTAEPYVARLNREIRASLADIISSDAAGIVTEYSLRTVNEKLICVLQRIQYTKSRPLHKRRLEINLDTSAFNGKITKFAIQILAGMRREWEAAHYMIVISGPDGELEHPLRFNELCPTASIWRRPGHGKLWLMARAEYRRQMLELMAQF